MKKFIVPALSLACAFLMIGCASGTHIITGETHPALKPSDVRLYQVPPPKFEIVGIVNSRTPGRHQHNMDDAVDELKNQAAEIGANGIIIGAVNPGSESVGFSSGTGFGSGGSTFFGSGISSSSSGIQLSGQAIFVYPEK
jgi:hypothetical protein